MRLILTQVLFCCFSAIAVAQESITALQSSAPAPVHYRSLLQAVGTQAGKQIPSLGAFVVWQHGAVVYEGYYHGQTRDSLFLVQSCTKSLVSAVAGAARMRGYLPDLDTPVIDILPEYKRKIPESPQFWNTDDWRDADTILHTLTLRHLLTMQTGFNYQEFGASCNAFMFASDPVRFACDLGFSEEPGTRFNYCSPGSHLFAVALARLIPGDFFAFADSTVLRPAGITSCRWPVDPQNRYLGFSHVQLTARDMIRFGILYLKKGNLDGKQILPESWIRESLAAHARLPHWDVLPGANGYGYFWWRRKSNTHQVYVCSGYGGQLICVIPDLDMVIATACILNDANRGRSEIKRLHLLMDKIIAGAPL